MSASKPPPEHFEIVDRKGNCAGGVKFAGQVAADDHLRALGKLGADLTVALITERVVRTVVMLPPLAKAA